VNSPIEEVLSISTRMGFQTVQLHGDEAPEYCKLLKDKGLELIKVFNISRDTRFREMEDYLDCCDLFLMDTGGAGFGGTGEKFDWTYLKKYDLEKPFFLSGGIGPEDADSILNLDHPQLFGVDLNSKFEKEPGLKDIQKLKGFVRKIRGS
jgi:phosphoribosylanthranilate isomerase